MKPSKNSEGGFTLLELLAAITILALMAAMLFSAFNQASRAWLEAENRVETFTEARAALDLMSRELSQAIGTSNISFLGSSTNVAFIAPISTSPLDFVDLEEVVYQRNSNSLVRQVTPFSAGATWDFYTPTKAQTWPEDSTSSIATVADNIVFFDLSYVYTNGVSETFWNSTALSGSAWSAIPNSSSANAFPGAQGAMTNRPPAGVQITIGAIDKRAMARLQAIAPNGTNTAPQTVGAYTNVVIQATKYFTTFVPIPNGRP
jgi:prepilin-type N-terminal cleavage/methylation domain-containing protein